MNNLNNAMLKLKIKNKKGSILAYTLIMVFVTSIILSAISYFVISNVRYANTREDREKSFQIAEAGIFYYKWYLSHKAAENPTKKQLQEFWESGDAYGVSEAYVSDYEGLGQYSITVIPPEGTSTIAIVESTGWTYENPNLKRTIKVRFRQPSWAEFAVLCNDKVHHIRFGEGTEVYGPIHSNGGIRFDGLSHNIVSSSLEEYDDPDHGGGHDEFGVHTHINPVDPYPPADMPDRLDVFEAGRKLGEPVVDFNSLIGDLAFMKEEAGCDYEDCEDEDHLVGVNGHYFNNDRTGRHIKLKTDGTFDIRTVQSMSFSTSGITNYSGDWETYDIPDDGVIFVENKVWVEGSIDGNRTTIVAANLTGSSSLEDIYLSKSITYTNYDGTDILGYIAQGDVEVIKNSDDIVRIDGAMIAKEGRVGRKYYGKNYKDTITTYGSIITAQRYGFAYTDGTGYAIRNLLYDNNLLYYPPPYFPTITSYVIDQWEEL